MSETPMMDALKTEVDKLQSLLADPQPGLLTWRQLLYKRWGNIVQLWHDGPSTANLSNQLDGSKERP